MVRKIFAALLLSTMIFFAQNVSAQSELSYQANVEGSGWKEPVKNGEVAGTVMQAKRLEALIINFAGGIKYSAHIQNFGWQDWVYAGGVAGTVGQNLRMEAIRIQLTGRAEKYFDVYYRMSAGSAGQRTANPLARRARACAWRRFKFSSSTRAAILIAATAPVSIRWFPKPRPFKKIFPLQIAGDFFCPPLVV